MARFDVERIGTDQSFSLEACFHDPAKSVVMDELLAWLVPMLQEGSGSIRLVTGLANDGVTYVANVSVTQWDVEAVTLAKGD